MKEVMYAGSERGPRGQKEVLHTYIHKHTYMHAYIHTYIHTYRHTHVHTIMFAASFTFVAQRKSVEYISFPSSLSQSCLGVGWTLDLEFVTRSKRSTYGHR